MKSKNPNKNTKDNNNQAPVSYVPNTYLLSDLPIDARLSEVLAFLPAWLRLFDVKASHLRRVKAGSTARLEIVDSAPFTNQHYRTLSAFFADARFRDAHQIQISPLEAPRTLKARKNAATDEICKQFWEYLVERNNVMICNRDDVGDYVDKFAKETISRKKPKMYNIIRGLKMMKAMKTVRINHHLVLAVFADPDSLDFPEQEFINKAAEVGKARFEEEKLNKNGVTISELPARIMGAIGETEVIELEATTEAPILLRSVDISGANGKMFQVANEMPMAVGPSLTVVKLTVKPYKLGVIRAKVTLKFENDDASTFVIVRIITMSCGDKAMNEVLKPTSTYQRKKRSYLRYDKKDTVGPPKEVKLITGLGGGGGRNEGPNPFSKLSQYKVPTEVMESIRADQYSTDMDGIGWSTAPSHDSIQDYGKYWRHLLYASEYQMLRDIRFYDMENAPLSKEGRYYVLKVPGLAEGRPSVLRGDLVHIDFQNMLYKGRVMFVRQLEVVMDLHNRFGKSFNTGLDRVTVHFTFSRMTLRTSHKAMNAFAEKELGASILVPTKEHVAQYQNINGDRQVRLTPRANRSLNPEQEAAVQNIVNGHLRPMPYIIFGPPGTGKTTTVVEAIYQLSKKGKKILLVTPSNDAADILVDRLSSYFPPSELRRILAYSRSITAMPANIQSYATDSLDSVGQAREIMGAKIVVSTVNLAARFSYWGIPRGQFDVMCIDEAGHATEPEVVAAAAGLMNFQETNGEVVGQLILAGDPKQLGPISNSDICRKYGLTMSLMERLTEREVYGLQADGKYPKDLLTKLVRNYRSHPSILKLPNEMFYSDLQCCGDPMVTRNMARWEHLPKSGFPVIFHAVDGENLREGNSPSWFNPTEAQQVVEYVRLLSRETKPPIRADEIGIITPYARQAQKIRLALGTQNMDDVKVGSVESFQGQERRVIILSTVRAEREEVSNDLRYNLGFVANPKRFNVAITRAKALLIVVGCPAVLALDEDNWLPFMKYCHENGSWVGESWDPSMADEDGIDDVASTGSESSEESSSDGEDLEGPSRFAEEEGFVVVNSEE